MLGVPFSSDRMGDFEKEKKGEKKEKKKITMKYHVVGLDLAVEK